MIFEKEFKQICKYCDEILLSEYANKEIIATSWLHVIREHSEFTNRYQVLFKKKKNLFSLLLIKNFLIQIIRIIKNFFLQKNKLSTIGECKNIDVLIISHFLNINQIGKEEDFYFGNMPFEIKKLGKNVVIGLINHTNENSKSVKKKWKIKPSIDRIIFGKDVDIITELKIIFDLLKTFLNLKKNFYGNNKFKNKIVDQLKIELFSSDTINNLKLYYQFKKILEKNTPEKVVLIHEGHAHERIIFKSIRETKKKIKCIGYQHACIFKNQHSIKRNLKHSYNPDIILTSGEKQKIILNKHFEEKNLLIEKIGSHRYLKKKINFYSKKERFCLVIPEGLPRECKYLFDLTLKYSQKFRDMKFIWRLHPIITFNYLKEKKFIPLEIPENIILSKNNLERDIINCKWALYRGTTAIFTAVANGLYPIYYNYKDTISTDPLYEVNNRSIIKNVYDLNNLFLNEHYYLNYKNLSLSADYCNQSFEKYNQETINKIFNEKKN